MKILSSPSHAVPFRSLTEGSVFMDEDDIVYMKIRPYDDRNVVRLIDGLLDSFCGDDLVDSYPEAFLTLNKEGK
jgi:hypothetical protein